MAGVAPRRYYSHRRGSNPNTELSLAVLKRLFLAGYRRLLSDDYLQEALGYECIDAGAVPGTLGEDTDASVLFLLRKTNVWPISEENVESYSEDDLFDIMELVFDCVSKPIDGRYHSYGSCGWHYSEFDKAAGQERLRSELNPLLADYSTGYELTKNGEIVTKPPSGLEKLLAQEVPSVGPPDARERVADAIRKYRSRSASVSDKRDAIRDLADVLEFVRPQLKGLLPKSDEQDLFNLANNYSIRHHNTGQKADYDQDLWLPWMFYTYLNMVHVALRLISRQANRAT